MKIQPQDILTIAQAARVAGLSRQSMNDAVGRGAVPIYWIAGKRCVLRHEAEKYGQIARERRICKSDSNF